MLGNHVILQLKYNEKLDFTELPSFQANPLTIPSLTLLTADPL